MSAPASRRGVLRGLTTLPLIGGVAILGAPEAVAGPVSSPSQPDPALTGIAETRAALDRALSIEAASLATDSDLPPEWGIVVGEAVEAIARIAAPTTLAGCRALARLTLDARPALGLDLDDEMPRILGLIADYSEAVESTLEGGR